MFKDHITLRDYEINDGMVSVEKTLGPVEGYTDLLCHSVELGDVLEKSVRLFSKAIELPQVPSPPLSICNT